MGCSSVKIGKVLIILSKELSLPGKTVPMQQRDLEDDGEQAMLVWRLGRNIKAHIRVSVARP